jgi:hypothetical protein
MQGLEEIWLGLTASRASHLVRTPTACGVGCILSPHCGLGFWR